MSKIRGPLLSMKASGQIGKSQVYASWKGIPYARQYVIPANPQSSEQSITRKTFAFLQNLFRQLGASSLLPWEIYVSGRPMISRNGYTKANLHNLRPEATLASLVNSPGAKGGPAFADFAAVTGGSAGELDLTITEGTLPAGWSVTSAGFLAVLDQTPQDAFSGVIAEASVANPGPYEATLTSPSVGVAHACMGWLIYERADGTQAVSPSGTIVANSHA